MKMIEIACVLSVLVSAGEASAREPVRIDSSSEASFEASLLSLVRSLKQPERRIFALGLLGTLLSKKCLGPEAIVRLTFFPVSLDDAPALWPCQQHLNGVSYSEIAEAAKAEKKQSSLAAPNKSSERNPLRGVGLIQSSG